MAGTSDRPSEAAATPLAMELEFNPFDPAFLRDPYPAYEAMRTQAPVFVSPFGVVLLFRYADVVRVLRDPTVSVEERHQRPTPLTELVQSAIGDRAEIARQSMLNRDPPDHSRLRRLVSKAFTPRAIESLRPRIQSLVDQALAPCSPGDRIDLVDALAFPIPFAVICDMLGMPPTDREDVRKWSHMLVKTLEPVLDPEVVRQSADARDALLALVADVVAWKRRSPADDMLTALIAAEENGDVLSDEELFEQIVLLFVAGHETTVNLIGNGVNALLRNPQWITRFDDDPANAIDELLRYDSPVHLSRRITLQPLVVRDEKIDAGSFVACVLASANRDPEIWGPSADTLDLARPNAGHHVSFGGGHHYCLGAALARLEGQIAIGTLLRRFPGLHQAGEPTPNGRINLRGPATLPVIL